MVEIESYHLIGGKVVIKLNEAIERLQLGEVIGVPTDTVYGFASLEFSVDKIYKLKGREMNKKIIKMISSKEILKIKDNDLLKLMDEVWPGATTIIFDHNGSMESFRIPNEKNLLKLLSEINVPVYVTSANESGEKPCVTRKEFEKKFPKVPLLEEIVECSKSNTPSKILLYNSLNDIIQIR